MVCFVHCLVYYASGVCEMGCIEPTVVTVSIERFSSIFSFPVLFLFFLFSLVILFTGLGMLVVRFHIPIKILSIVQLSTWPFPFFSPLSF